MIQFNVNTQAVPISDFAFQFSEQENSDLSVTEAGKKALSHLYQSQEINSHLSASKPGLERS